MIARLLAALVFVGMLSAPEFAGAMMPTVPGAAPPAVLAPLHLAAAKKGTPTKEPITTRINLNTADAMELDRLPQIGPARAKAIVTARTKSPFKGWDDFVARKVIPANAQRAIKDLVTF